MALLGFFMPPETGEKINMCKKLINFNLYYYSEYRNTFNGRLFTGKN